LLHRKGARYSPGWGENGRRGADFIPLGEDDEFMRRACFRASFRHAMLSFTAFVPWQVAGITWCSGVNCCDAKRRLAGIDTRFAAGTAGGQKLSKASDAQGVAFPQQKTAGLAGGRCGKACTALSFLHDQNAWL
jgi:hypothetical protein